MRRKPDVITGATQLLAIRESLTTRFKVVKIADGLIFAPCM
jgi:hypothetical protein